MATEKPKFDFNFFYWFMLGLFVVGIIILCFDVPAHGDWSGGLTCGGLGIVLGLIGFVGDKLTGHA